MAEPFQPGAPRAERLGLTAIGAALVAVITVSVAIGVISSSTRRGAVASDALANPSARGPSTASTSPDPSAGRADIPLHPAALRGAPPGVGWIAAVDGFGTLSLIAPDGRAVALSERDTTTVGFPAFSPDGRRLAAIGSADESTTVDVFPIDRQAGAAGSPVPIYRSGAQQAFYLSWTPGGREVSFLANDADVVVLRIAAADRATALDETDRASLVRRGAPLYFDWLDDDEALVHVGVGGAAFLGLLGRDGSDHGGTLPSPGDFRSAQVSPDGRSVGWVRTEGERSVVVLAARDGSAERTVPVFGPAAVVFSPTDDRLATIGAVVPGERIAFPLGPLRTIDARSGDVHVLLDGAVVASFWSPDGGTLAAIRLQVPSGTTALAPAPIGTASPTPVPSEIHLVFVDVASGDVRSDRVIRPGSRFVSEILPYFDQYELSHRLWAPDSSLFLLPITTAAGAEEVVAVPPDGGDGPFSIAAAVAFWSP